MQSSTSGLRLGLTLTSAALVAACGLSAGGLGDATDGSVADTSAGDDVYVPGDSGQPGVDATSGTDASAMGNDTGADHPDGHAGDAALDTSLPPPQDAGACLGTTASCGTPGACISCAGMARGTACTGTTCGCVHDGDCSGSSQGPHCESNGVCGCNNQNDCPTGNACGSSHVCSASCAGGLTCNGGCCDGNVCQPGNTNDACGKNGSACGAPCGGQTPTCVSGSCANACGGAGDGTCGTGFCCSNGQCEGNDNGPTCGASGAACMDCTGNARGSACKNGACGCNGNGDCTGAANGAVCEGSSGTCGCNVATDCPVGQACTNFKCGTSCGPAASPCNTGCCSAGSCVASCPMGRMCNAMSGQCM